MKFILKRVARSRDIPNIYRRKTSKVRGYIGYIICFTINMSNNLDIIRAEINKAQSLSISIADNPRYITST